MLRTSLLLAVALPAPGVDNNKVVSSSDRNNIKSAKSNFIKPVHRAKESSFLTSNARQAFTQLRQAFTEFPIFWHFDSERYIQIETDTFGYAINGILS